MSIVYLLNDKHRPHQSYLLDFCDTALDLQVPAVLTTHFEQHIGQLTE